MPLEKSVKKTLEKVCFNLKNISNTLTAFQHTVFECH